MKAVLLKTLVGTAVLMLCSVSQGMNLLQAYQAAVDQDAGIRASRAALQSGRERLPQARAQLLPSVSASVGRNNNNLITTAPNLLGNLSETRDTYFSFNKTLALRQPIFNLQRVFQYQQSKDQVAESEATYDKDLQTLSVRVGGAYLEALLSGEQLRLVRAQKAQYTAMVDAARKSLAAGTGTRTDIDDAQARLDLAIASELEFREKEAALQRALRRLPAYEPPPSVWEGVLVELKPRRIRPMQGIDHQLFCSKIGCGVFFASHRPCHISSVVVRLVLKIPIAVVSRFFLIPQSLVNIRQVGMGGGVFRIERKDIFEFLLRLIEIFPRTAGVAASSHQFGEVHQGQAELIANDVIAAEVESAVASLLRLIVQDASIVLLCLKEVALHAGEVTAEPREGPGWWRRIHGG